jgi:hypothetical protein
LVPTRRTKVGKARRALISGTTERPSETAREPFLRGRVLAYPLGRQLSRLYLVMDVFASGGEREEAQVDSV